MDYFMMSVDVAEEFFHRCLLKEAVTEPERLAILKDLMEEKKLMAAGHTDLTKEEFAKEMSQDGRNVLIVNGKKRQPRIGFDFKQEDDDGR